MNGRRIAVVLAVVVVAIAIVIVRLRPGPGGRRPGPSATPPAAQPSAVDFAGTSPAGDIWAIQGSNWLTSADAGATWRRRAMPLDASSVLGAEALDSTHAWVIAIGPGSTQVTGDPTDILHLLVERTTDGGATWQTSSLAGNYAAHEQSLVFVDSLRGFLMSAATRFSDGVSTVLRTDDGGATWEEAGRGRGLGPLFAATDRSTLWAGTPQRASPIDESPLLELSRDGGRTWHDAGLPGFVSRVGGGDVWLDGPVIAPDPVSVLVTVTAMDAGVAHTRVYLTANAGKSWTVVSDRARHAAAGPALLDAAHWLLPLVNPFGLATTTDGGVSWHDIATSGLGNGGWIVWMGGLDARHAIAVGPTGHSYPGATQLYVTADAGKTWTSGR